jgi:hypothetical protein
MGGTVIADNTAIGTERYRVQSRPPRYGPRAGPPRPASPKAGRTLFVDLPALYFLCFFQRKRTFRSGTIHNTPIRVVENRWNMFTGTFLEGI